MSANFNGWITCNRVDKNEFNHFKKYVKLLNFNLYNINIQHVSVIKACLMKITRLDDTMLRVLKCVHKMT